MYCYEEGNHETHIDKHYDDDYVLIYDEDLGDSHELDSRVYEQAYRISVYHLCERIRDVHEVVIIIVGRRWHALTRGEAMVVCLNEAAIVQED